MILMSNNEELCIGIDLGTTNSVACAFSDGEFKFIPSSESTSINGRVFPSYVAFMENEILVGELARRQLRKNSDKVVHSIKKHMGTDKKMTFRGEIYTPQRISSLILQKIKEDAEKFLRKPVKDAIITVPANFDNNQIAATIDAGKIAGLNVLETIEEPNAACLSYGFDKKGEGIQKILVFDMGGGTLDVTIMEHGAIFEVLSTAGNLSLGGEKMDYELQNYLNDEFKMKYNIDLLNNPKASERLLEAAERAKIDLSSILETTIDLDMITRDNDGNYLDFETKISRSKLERLVKHIVNKCGITIQEALDTGNLTKEDIDKLILVGGPTRMPIVKEYVENYLGKTAEGGIDPMECVARGAAIKAASINGAIEPIPIRTVTPLSLGIKSNGDLTDVIIKRNTKIPIEKTRKFKTISDNQTTIRVEIVQGENRIASDNTYLGSFVLNVPPAPRGKTIVEITFKINEDGMLSVIARDKSTGNENSIDLDTPNQMDDIEIEKAMKWAEANAENNKKRAKFAELKNEAERLTYHAGKLMDSTNITYGDKMYFESLISNLNKSIEDSTGRENPKFLIITANINKLKEAIRKFD